MQNNVNVFARVPEIAFYLIVFEKSVESLRDGMNRYVDVYRLDKTHDDENYY